MYCTFQGYLRQATASQVVLVGPYVDATDGFTPETGLTIANTDLKLSKNGAASANKNSGGGTHIEQGLYAITLDATDTSAVGKLYLASLVAGARLVTHTWTVLEEAVYDASFVASAPGPLSMAVISKPGQATPGDTATPDQILGTLYKLAVNKTELTATARKIYSNDSATVDQKSTVSNDGVTLAVSKVTTGP